MELIERSGFLARLNSRFEETANGEGHCILLSGEAGMGKSSLIKAFCKERKNDCKVYQGTCDALFTPRPLAPLYDIIWQLGSETLKNSVDLPDRAELFAGFLKELGSQKETSLIIFEDIHWADEATLDFIKFLSRRITQVRCFFILTYRNDEIHSRHPLRNVLGQLPADSFTRLELSPLSKEAVQKMAAEKGYCGEDVYSISNGNPFYVNEILASYSTGVPENIKDSILSVYNRQCEDTRQIWEILSVQPTGFEIKYLEKVMPTYAAAVEKSLDAKILVLKDDSLFFKHELYRRTIEASISPIVRVELNKKILALFIGDFKQNGEIQRIIHHAKNANEFDLVVDYVPAAAKTAACLGAHIEASKLYAEAIRYYQGNDEERLIQFYEAYAYECYLTNQTKEAIIYQEKVLAIFQQKNYTQKIGDCMRFLSRLWWFEGNRSEAERYGFQAIKVLENEPATSAKAMAYSNISQLKMLSHEPDDCMFWGSKAISMSKELGDQETLSHALNNVGTVQMEMQSLREVGFDVLEQGLHDEMPSMREIGRQLLQQSLEISLSNSFHEHAARAYTNLGVSAIRVKDYVFGKKILDDGIRYCEKRDLDSWTTYMLSQRARLEMETGLWDEAFRNADDLIRNEGQPSIIIITAFVIIATIRMRKGDNEALSLLLASKIKAFETMELQRIIPVMVALLEYEWLTGETAITKADLDYTILMVSQMGNVYENSEFAFWLLKVKGQRIQLREIFEGFQTDTPALAVKAAELWKKAGSPYEQALTLFEGDDHNKSEAIKIVQKLGATVTYQKMKMEMRASGIKNIPRGIRQTTMSNVANLTLREIDVLRLLQEGMQNKEIASKLFISAKTVDHHISAILFKLNVNSRAKAVNEAISLDIIK